MAISEFELISNIKKWVNNKGLVVPIGDDAAAFDLNPKLSTLFTSDSLVENVHFKLNTIKPSDLGYKSLTANISDIAAMGGTPLFATVALGLPTGTKKSFINQLYKGLIDASDQYSVKIVGGDISAAKEIVINIGLIGQVSKDLILRRSSAKAGDDILVTGKLGLAAAKKYLTKPIARIKEAQLAAKIGVKTAIDVSDGLASDSQRICEASKVGLTLFADKIPIDKEVSSFAKNNQALQSALSGGEDYELIFTVHPKLTDKLMKEFKRQKWSLSLIGKVNSSKKVEVIDESGKLVKWKKGYEHFV